MAVCSGKFSVNVRNSRSGSKCQCFGCMTAKASLLQDHTEGSGGECASSIYGLNRFDFRSEMFSSIPHFENRSRASDFTFRYGQERRRRRYNEEMQASIIAFDNVTDIDVFFLWELLNRVRSPNWTVRILGERERLISSTGMEIKTHGRLREAERSEVVLFSSGPGTRQLRNDRAFLSQLILDPARQMIGSMCSGALLLAALGLLEGKSATTYPTATGLLEDTACASSRRRSCEGNIATAAGCLAAQYLAGWVLEEKFGATTRDRVLRSVQPVGEGLLFSDAAYVATVYADPAQPAEAAAAEARLQQLR